MKFATDSNLEIEPFDHLKMVSEQIAEPIQPGAISLLSFWREREALDGFVVGRDVPCRRIAPILRNISLFEPVGRPGDIHDMIVRVAGDALRERFGRDTKGARLSELLAKDVFEENIAQIGIALHRRAPYIVRTEYRRHHFVQRRQETVVLPVWSARRDARWVLTGTFYFN